MELINDHGLTITNLHEASAKCIERNHAVFVLNHILYNTQTGKVLCDTADGYYNHGLPSTQYHDPDIISITTTYRHMTEQEIADAIYQRIIFLRDSRDYGTPCHIDWNSLHD